MSLSIGLWARVSSKGRRPQSTTLAKLRFWVFTYYLRRDLQQAGFLMMTHR